MVLSPDARHRLDDLTGSFRAEHQLPTVVLGVVAHGGLIHLATAADPDHGAATADTAYRIASMTKSFTAATVLLLRDQGRLRLDDPIATLVPELVSLRAPTSDAPTITVRHLLSMSAGLAGDDPWADRLLDADADAMDALFRSGATFAAAPGTGFVYSNFGYAMLGRAVTNVTGRPFQDVVTAEVLQPLGLTLTGWRAPAGARAAGAYWRLDGELVPEPVLDDGGFAAMGGLWSTMGDLARWCGWLLDAFPSRDGPDGPVLSRASRREMQQVATAWPPAVTVDGGETRVLAGGYGYGLNVAVDSRLGPMVHHSGGLPGYGSNMRWLPGRGVAAIALTNLRYAPARHLTMNALDALAAYGHLPTELAPAASPELEAAAAALVALLNDWRPESARALFSFNVDLDEGLERLGRLASQRLTAHGPLEVRSFTALNWAEADVGLIDGRGQALTLSLMLSPEPSARIQWYELTDSDRP
jgi:CubicO group peptidase (beta-lactamase class C family)